MYSQTTPQVNGRRAAMNAAAGTLWYLPGSFGIARLLGPSYSLRCVLFHDVSDTESVFTKGLNGTTTCKNFEQTLKFLTKYYTPVSLQDVLDSFEGRDLPPRPVLVTFDDAYASVCEVAAPLCKKFSVPAVFFVNASCLDNRELALDNLVCYVANTAGLEAVDATMRSVEPSHHSALRSLAEVFGNFLPNISLAARKTFRSKLLELARAGESELAAEAGLYLSSEQLRDLASFNIEIGDHTYTHVHCRSLQHNEYADEIARSREILERVSGSKVRSFSVPYGSSADLTADTLSYLQQSGCEAIFLAEGRANFPYSDPLRLNRVSIKAETDASLFSEIEVLPRLRSASDGMMTASSSNHSRRRVGLDQTLTRQNSRPPSYRV
jgi:peptidoglycan/xylan/chitin deacetylase (PgdA/CDA1 family)